MFLSFPNFNVYSTPLFVLVCQGILFGFLLLWRYREKKILSDLFLAMLVLITCYHRTTYTIGFMDWYDTFRNTKINYWLIYLGLAVGPLIYFYVKSITSSNFNFRKKDRLHFIPVLVYIVYRIFIFVYDANQPGFEESQNGYLMQRLEIEFMGIFFESFFVAQHLLYLAFTLQLYYSYRIQLPNYFSNTYRLELNWIRNFLFLYAFLFVYSVIQQLVNTSILELSWIQKWWYQFFSALVVIYIGVKGYFTDTTTLSKLDFDIDQAPTVTRNTKAVFTAADNDNSPTSGNLNSKMMRVSDYMKDQQPYLNPDLNLAELAGSLQMTRGQLSDVINTGFSKNFND
ncbi:MAG: AraC family transcriptional regulator, partial [Flavobacteriaceae bacterium]